VEKERKIKVLSLVALVVAVLGLTVAFAALSQTLTITGLSGMQQEDWDIRIQSDDKYHSKGTDARNQMFECLNCKNTTSAGTLQLDVGDNYNTLSGFEFELEKPGDMAGILFYVANYASIDAKLEQIISNKPICTSDIGNEEDEKLVCNNLVVNYGYVRDGALSPEEFNNFNLTDAFREGDVILGNHTTSGNWPNYHKKRVAMFIKLNDNLDVLPTSKVTVSNLGFILKYVQK